MVRRWCGPVYLVSYLLLSLVVSCCVLLVDRLNATRKESFLFHMEVLHPMQNPRGDDMKRLPVTVRSLNDDSSLGGQRLMPVTVRERHERGGGKRDICIWAVTWRAPYIPSGILRRHDPPPCKGMACSLLRIWFGVARVRASFVDKSRTLLRKSSLLLYSVYVFLLHLALKRFTTTPRE